MNYITTDKIYDEIDHVIDLAEEIGLKRTAKELRETRDKVGDDEKATEDKSAAFANVIINETLSQKNCLMCQNNCEMYCAILHRALKENEVKNNPCVSEKGYDAFESLFTEFEVVTIQNVLAKPESMKDK